MKRSFQEFYEDYWNYRKEIGKIHVKDRIYIPARLNAVLSMIEESKKELFVLDIGCGEGTLGKLIKEKLNNVYIIGCDISNHSLKLASPYYDKVFQIDIEGGDLAKTVKQKKFDYIICVETLEHLMYPQIALDKCRKQLSQNGYLITSFPNIAWWKYRLKLLKGYFPEESRLYHHAEHLHDFTMHTFAKLLKEAGLEPVEVGGEFIPPKFMQRLKPKKLIDKFIRKYPNLFGYQVVIKTRMK